MTGPAASRQIPHMTPAVSQPQGQTHRQNPGPSSPNEPGGIFTANLTPTTKASAGKTPVQRHRQRQPLDRRHPWGGRDGGRQDHDLPLGARYRRIVQRRGTKRALVAVGNSILTIAYHLLSDPHARYTDLGVDFHDRFHPQRRTRQVIRELEHLSGKKVTLHTAA
jgi:hypothetical protein